MPGDYLLDTNLFVAYFAHEQRVIERILAAESVIASAVVLGELHFGAACSQNPDQNRARIDQLLEWAVVAACDHQTASIFGVMKQSLRAKGRMVPDNDIWIAATAQQLGVTLVTRDEHFREFDHLVWESW